MIRAEIAALLAFVDKLDPSRAPQSRPAAGERLEQWSILLEHVPATAQHPEGRHWDVSQVAARHLATSPYPIKPSDIGAPWETYRADVVGRHHDPAPAVDPDDEAAYRAALRRTRQAVAVGALPPAPQLAIEGAVSPVRAQRDADALRVLAELGSYVPKTVNERLAPLRPQRAQRERLAAAGRPDPLTVECVACGATAGTPCRIRRIAPGSNAVSFRPMSGPHPSRIEAAAAHHANHQQEPAA
ncbi:cell surface glycoprotein [Streptomyces sp. NPDC098077]|uniref:zinc finger domain-containing protein n=1 Tax=Streptomyces sp. NPDC098077 TaxID=3366093 RepID=UPI0037F8FE06